MNLPSIHGIIATDQSGNIEFNGKPIGYAFDKESREFDRQILVTFIDKNVCQNSLIVVGKNTFRAMKHLIGGKGRVAVSDEKGVSLMWANGHEICREEYDENVSPKQALALKVFSYCLKANIKNVYVFGGKSVYESFAGAYSTLTHVEFKSPLKPVEGSRKPVIVRKSTSSGMGMVRSKDSLLHPYTNSSQYLDMPTMKVVVYDNNI